ncbi:MAG: aminotransferase class I/II-fold pyridoxal phosphate-dependent enzyme [Candidatus Aenigmarchaeota archaeon]|nr:aminotransferase class I/II-fold pyridoxal phosphate-dependent enzyme [Candidatus Aenigmarchaeota archaeon]
MIESSERLKRFSTYAFAEVDKAKEAAAQKGFRIIDFGVGDPTDPLYEGAIKGLQQGAEKHARSGYPSYIGMKEFRTAASEWLERRFQVSVDPETQITATAGAKEAIFHFPFAFINPGDAVLMPSIGYPPYKAGTVFAGGIPVYYDLREENNFLPDVHEIEQLLEANKNIQLMWINSPHNPTTVVAKKKLFEELIELAQKHNVIMASDEAYTEMYLHEKPHSLLEFSDDWSNLVIFHSLSKRSNATGLRIGFAAGGADIIRHYRTLRTQIDSGVANAIQEAAIAAWKDEQHVESMRQMYNKRRDVMTAALKAAGMKYWAEAAFYLWVKVGDSMGFAKKLLQLDAKNKVGINVTPGKMLALTDTAYADAYARFALVPSLDDTKQAAELIREHFS